MSLHLIHPDLVHFSVALLVVGAVAEAVGVLRGRPAMGRFGAGASLLGVAFLVATVASGFLAANSVPLPGRAHEQLEDHERAGLVLLGVWLLLVPKEVEKVDKKVDSEVGVKVDVLKGMWDRIVKAKTLISASKNDLITRNLRLVAKYCKKLCW